MNSHLIIRTCRHTFPDGRHCQGAAVRGRACCRHHLDARTRLHNMARARRLACIPRFRVLMTPRDLASNRSEVLRVLATRQYDPATQRMMRWALQLSANLHRLESASRARRTSRPAVNRNGIYQVPINPLFPHGYTETHAEMIENKRGMG